MMIAVGDGGGGRNTAHHRRQQYRPHCFTPNDRPLAACSSCTLADTMVATVNKPTANDTRCSLTGAPGCIVFTRTRSFLSVSVTIPSLQASLRRLLEPSALTPTHAVDHVSSYSANAVYIVYAPRLLYSLYLVQKHLSNTKLLLFAL